MLRVASGPSRSPFPSPLTFTSPELLWGCGACVGWSCVWGASSLTRALLFPCRLAELAPQYYLSNLPPGESRDSLMELRGKLAGGVGGSPQAQAPLAATAAEDNEDVCVLQ